MQTPWIFGEEQNFQSTSWLPRRLCSSVTTSRQQCKRARQTSWHPARSQLSHPWGSSLSLQPLSGSHFCQEHGNHFMDPIQKDLQTHGRKGSKAPCLGPGGSQLVGVGSVLLRKAQQNACHDPGNADLAASGVAQTWGRAEMFQWFHHVVSAVISYVSYPTLLELSAVSKG